MSLYTLFLLVKAAAAVDLTVDGTTVTMDGAHEYDNVYVINGGTLAVTDYDGSGTTGTLTLRAGNIYVDSTSRVDAIGAGYRGVLNSDGEGPGGGTGGLLFVDSGGGGGYGSAGGNGVRDNNTTVDGRGGPAYGSSTDIDIDMGSAGGAGGGSDGDSGGSGADGGGAVWFHADQIVIAGTIQAYGLAGTVVNGDSPGGGAGGGVLLFAADLDCTGTINAYGGSGADTDDNGGGGGGGRVKQLYDTATSLCTVAVTGGAGPDGATAGGSGTTHDDVVDYDTDGFTSEDGDCDPTDASVYPGAFELPDGIDNDCNGYTEADDSDSDGLTDEEELVIGTDIESPDSDGDGVWDGDEVGDDLDHPVDTDGDGLPDWDDPDDDGDGVLTEHEVGDFDAGVPGSILPDSDGDEVPDFLDPDDDGDGILTVIEEVEDADGDGLADPDADNDGIPNYLDTDSDGDGAPDRDEGTGDTDGDGIADYVDPLVENPDTGDTGGVDTGDTDVVDTGDTDVVDTGDTDIVDTDPDDTDDTDDTDSVGPDPDTDDTGLAFTYEGGGGWGCDATSAHGAPGGLLAGLALPLLALLRRRRRA